MISNNNKAVERLINYYVWERATKYQGEIIVPSRKFALDTIIDVYSKMQTDFAEEYVRIAKQKLTEKDTPTLGNFCYVEYKK